MAWIVISMMPGLNPRKMQQMMKKMGMQQVDIVASEVIIKCEDKDIIITNPSVSKINMMGQETFQVVGNVEERAHSTTPEISGDDVKTVMEQADVDEAKAKAALEENKGDLAASILSLKG